ncbi:MAG TPA: HXXEE domain-containing protein [Bordetella sp.]|jgi:hypothetical protein|nr:HXXEE domain-containing protein [Bordetella sp.]
MSFDFDWPWVGIALAAILLSLLLLTDIFRTPGIASRWRDPAWLAVLGLPLYMVHQFEEHGIDLAGIHYAFRASLCSTMGFADVSACPIPLSFITAVNVGSVWGASVLAFAFGRRRPVIALSAYGIPLVNAIPHVASALKGQSYNPGLLTAILLFVPVGIWAMRVGLRAGIRWRGVGAIILGGILTHAVLMGSLLAFLQGWIGAPVLAVIQMLNMAVPLVVALIASGPGATSRDRDRARSVQGV